VKEDLIDVESVQIVESSEATGEFRYFEIKYGRLEEEFGERMGTAIEHAKTMRSEIRSMHKDLKSDTGGIKDAIKEMHEDLKGETAGIRGAIAEMPRDLKDEIIGVRGEITDMRVDINKSFLEIAERYDAISKELVRTREELTRAVDTLVELVRQFTKRG